MPRRYDVPCTLGLEEVLVRELGVLGARSVRPRRGGVTCEGDSALGMAACLWLRSAVRVQEILADEEVASGEALYDLVRGLPWERWMRVGDTLAVDASVRDAPTTHSGWAALRVKDAVVDRFRDRTGARPSVDTADPVLPLKLSWKGTRLRLARDLAGRSLHKRGYRPVQVRSPLSEATAAGLLLLAGWDGSVPLADPMCGSGTFLVEAAWIAGDRAPGLDREFVHQRWPDHDAEAWRALRQAARERVREAAVPVLGADRHEGALAIARDALRRAGVDRVVRLERSRAASWRPEPVPGFVITNPPYGERLGEADEAWRELATFLREGAPGARAHVLCGDKALSRHLRLRADRRWPVRNGPLDCRLLRYDIRPRRPPAPGPAPGPAREPGAEPRGGGAEPTAAGPRPDPGRRDGDAGTTARRRPPPGHQRST